MKCFLFLIAVLALAACEPPPPPPPSTAELERERQRRVQAEQRAAENEAARDFWHRVTMVAGAGAIVLLFVGAALGSKARNDVRRN